MARMEWVIGTTVLQTFEDRPRGHAARAALLRLLLAGGHRAAQVAAAQDEVEAHGLLASMEGLAAPGFEEWLRQRIADIGFESGDDLALLTDDDLRPGLLTDEQRAMVDRDFPRQLEIGGLGLTASYDLAQRRVTLRAARSGRPAPRPDFLPRWPGWTVVYDDGKHSMVLR